MDPRPRVCFLINGLTVGGAEKLFVELVNRLDRVRFRATVVTLSPRNPLASAIEPDAVEVIALQRRWRYDLSLALRLRRALKSRGPACIVSFGMFEFFFARLATGPRQPSVRHVISIHTLPTASRKAAILTSLLYRRFLSGRETIVSVARAQAEDWSRFYRIPRSWFTIVHNGVDIERFCLPYDGQKRRGLRCRLGIPDDAFVFLMAARLTPVKAHDVALRALAILGRLADGEKVRLLLIGDGDAAHIARLMTLAARLGLGERVSFCGPQSDVVPFYHAADAFTLTSRSEALPLAAIEAMSTGLPCVLTDVGGAREMIQEGRNGYLVQPNSPNSIAEGWSRVLLNRDRFDPKTVRGTVEGRFTLSQCVAGYERLIAAALESNSVQGTWQACECG